MDTSLKETMRMRGKGWMKVKEVYTREIKEQVEVSHRKSSPG